MCLGLTEIGKFVLDRLQSDDVIGPKMSFAKCFQPLMNRVVVYSFTGVKVHRNGSIEGFILEYLEGVYSFFLCQVMFSAIEYLYGWVRLKCFQFV